jgi:hypothetical protein
METSCIRMALTAETLKKANHSFRLDQAYLKSCHFVCPDATPFCKRPFKHHNMTVLVKRSVRRARRTMPDTPQRTQRAVEPAGIGPGMWNCPQSWHSHGRVGTVATILVPFRPVPRPRGILNASHTLFRRADPGYSVTAMATSSVWRTTS